MDVRGRRPHRPKGPHHVRTPPHPRRPTPPCSRNTRLPARDEPDPDLLLALDEEVAALPEHLRAAVLLCEMEGLGRKDASARLGVPEGTLSSRLAKARRVLADRLRGRGFALPAVGLASVLARPASAVPPRLLSAATALVDGSVLVPAAVASLSHGVFQTMFLTKLKGAALGALVLAALGWAIEFPAPPAASANPRPATTPDEKKPEEKKPQPAAKPGPGALLLARQSGLLALAPDGKEGAELTAPKDTHLTFIGRLSPDGKRAAFVVAENAPPRADVPETWPYKVVVHKLGTAEPIAVVDVPALGVTMSWTADGSRLVVTKWTGHKLETGTETVLIDPATGKIEPLDLPEGTRVLDCGPDGKTFLVTHWDGKKGRIGVIAKGDKEVKALAALNHRHGDNCRPIRADGKRVLYTDADPEQKGRQQVGHELQTVPAGRGDREADRSGRVPGQRPVHGCGLVPRRQAGRVHLGAGACGRGEEGHAHRRGRADRDRGVSGHRRRGRKEPEDGVVCQVAQRDQPDLRVHRLAVSEADALHAPSRIPGCEGAAR